MSLCKRLSFLHGDGNELPQSTCGVIDRIEMIDLENEFNRIEADLTTSCASLEIDSVLSQRISGTARN